MNLDSVKIENFRGYKDKIEISFNELTVLIGKNDAGKSSILDALDIFFNDSTIEKEDCCVYCHSSDVGITCVFSSLPQEVILDSQYRTTFANEYLLNDNGKLEITRTYNFSAAKAKKDIYATAYYPSVDGVNDLHALKNTDLKKRLKDNGIDVTRINQTVNAEMRHALWNGVPDLKLSTQTIPLSSDFGKNIWEQIQKELPVFALFKSDRASTDQDEEAQNPLKAAIKETIKEHEADLNGLLAQVKTDLESIVFKTVEKIQEMNPELAKEMTPQVKTKNWDSLFSVSLTGDDQIPINKRGSGTRRLILLNFFRAKAEETSRSKGSGIIYAIEEPETSQHPNHQIMLLDAFQELVALGKCQVILTSHTPTLVRKLDTENIRYIVKEKGLIQVRNQSNEHIYQEIAKTLGVLPNHDIKVFIGVEGKWDINFLRNISFVLSKTESNIPDLSQYESEGKVVFIPLGGSSLELWINRLAELRIPEFYITDRDNPPPAKPKYNTYIEAWNAREQCLAWVTKKRELENYIHPVAIQSHLARFPSVINDFDDIPLIFAKIVHEDSTSTRKWDELPKEDVKEKMGKAKKCLNTNCVMAMTPDQLTEIDKDSEIRMWLSAIGQKLN